jgi:hypothetical protein
MNEFPYGSPHYDLNIKPGITYYEVEQWCDATMGATHWWWDFNDSGSIQYLFETQESLSMFLMRWNDLL